MKFVALLAVFWLDIVLSQETFYCEIHKNIKCIFDSITIGTSNETLLSLRGSAAKIKTVHFQYAHFKSFPLIKFYETFDQVNHFVITNSTGLAELKSVLFPPKLEIIDVKYSDVESISASSFEMLKTLYNLQLRNNQIKTIDKNAFYHVAGTIDYISLEFNQIAWLHDDTFVDCAKLKTLVLSFNHLTTITAKLLSRNPALDGLAMANNKILTIEKKFTVPRLFAKFNFEGNVCVDISYDNIVAVSNTYKMKIFDTCFNNYFLTRAFNETLHQSKHKNVENSPESDTVVDETFSPEVKKDVVQLSEPSKVLERATQDVPAPTVSEATSLDDSSGKSKNDEIFMKHQSQEVDKCLAISLTCSIASMIIVFLMLFVFYRKILNLSLKPSLKQPAKFIATSASSESKF